jgi:hypothetical protein
MVTEQNHLLAELGASRTNALVAGVVLQRIEFVESDGGGLHC